MTYVYAVIERAVLSNGDENRLVVRTRVHAAHSVGTSRQAKRDLGGQDAIFVRCVETFKEHEHLRVQRPSRIQSRNCLNDHVAMTFNQPVFGDGL